MSPLGVAGESFENGVRRAAIDWLDFRTNGGEDPIHASELSDFTFQDEQFRLMAPQQGIWKPRRFEAAFSFRTTFGGPYNDHVGSDGLLRYAWRGDDPNFYDNRAMRLAMEQEKPLIYYQGIGDGLYQVVAPVFIVAEEPNQMQFAFTPTESARDIEAPFSFAEKSLWNLREKRYAERLAKFRLHQPVFRASVLKAYENRCAVCSLGNVDSSLPSLNRLIDAAHIVPDSHEQGIAAVANGMSMCKIHHAAFDANILGIRPDDLTVEIRTDILAAKDGPMLKYGLQERHGEKLMVVPRAKAAQPREDLLAVAYERFRSA